MVPQTDEKAGIQNMHLLPNSMKIMVLNCRKDSTLDDFFSVDQRYRIHANMFIKYDPDLTRADYVEKLERIMNTFAQQHDTWAFKSYVVSEEVFDSMDRDSQSAFLQQCVKKWDPDGETFYTEDSISIAKGEVNVDWSKAKNCLK